MDVSVIIISYNTKELLKICLTSIYQQTSNIMFEVIVSDNGSTDGSVEMIQSTFPQVKLICNNNNLGFGKANNIALRQAQGKYVFFLNSDTSLRNNAIKFFFDYWEKHAKEPIGALGCYLQNYCGEYIHSFNNLPNYWFICKYYLSQLIRSQAKAMLTFLKIMRCYKNKRKNLRSHCELLNREVGYITGADLFMLNDVNAFFDESFFMYYEDTEIGWRLSKQHLKRVVISSPKIVHDAKRTDNGFRITTKSHIYSQISSLIYAKKVLHKRGFFLWCIIHFDWLNPYVRSVVKTIPKEKLEGSKLS